MPNLKLHSFVFFEVQLTDRQHHKSHVFLLVYVLHLVTIKIPSVQTLTRNEESRQQNKVGHWDFLSWTKKQQQTNPPQKRFLEPKCSWERHSGAKLRQLQGAVRAAWISQEALGCSSSSSRLDLRTPSAHLKIRLETFRLGAEKVSSILETKLSF